MPSPHPHKNHPPLSDGLFASLYYNSGDWMRAEAGLAASFNAGFDKKYKIMPNVNLAIEKY